MFTISAVKFTARASHISGKKLDHKRDALDVSVHGRHFYLLVHNYKVKCLSFLDLLTCLRLVRTSPSISQVEH